MYGGDTTTRIMQEIILGVGGVRLLRALGVQPSVFHMNEGHAAFLILELVREGLAAGATFDDAFAAARLDVRWWCDARLEERVFNAESLPRLFAAGCRKLMFGFESGSQRVLDLVEKGTNLDEARRVIRAAHAAGISVTLYTMVGLPTETR